MKFRFEDLHIWQMAVEIGNRLFDIADDLEMRKLYRFADLVCLWCSVLRARPPLFALGPLLSARCFFKKGETHESTI